MSANFGDLLFLDSFQHYATADILDKWTTNSGSAASISPTASRWGGPAMSPGGGVSVTLFSNQATIYAGANFYFTTFPSDTGVFAFSRGSPFNNGAWLFILPNGKLYASNGGSFGDPDSSAASSFFLTLNTNYYIEFKATYSVAAGSGEVRVNGVTVLTFSGIRTSTSTGPTLLYYDTFGMMHPGFGYVSDLYVHASKFLGDIRVSAIFPNAAGDYQEWTQGAGSSHWSSLAETAPDGDTSYIVSSTLNQKDIQNFEDVALVGECEGAQFLISARKDDASAKSLTHLIKSGGSEYLGSVEGMGLSYTYFRDLHDVNPITGVKFTQSELNAIQYGAKVSA